MRSGRRCERRSAPDHTDLDERSAVANEQDVDRLFASQQSGVSKTCYVCSMILPLTQFYVDHRMTDGHLGICRRCVAARVKSNRLAKIELHLEYDRRRAFAPERVKYRTEYTKSARAKQSNRESGPRWKKRNPEKRQAHIIVGNAIRGGKLIKRPCESCGTSDRVHAHHNDYSKPLEVRWFCFVCHSRLHRRFDPDTGKALADGKSDE